MIPQGDAFTLNNKYIIFFTSVSRLIDICGRFSESLDVGCLQSAEPEQHKRIVVHKIHCCDDMKFIAPLRLLHHIYQVRLDWLRVHVIYRTILIMSFPPCISIRIELQPLLRSLMGRVSNQQMRYLYSWIVWRPSLTSASQFSLLMS